MTVKIVDVPAVNIPIKIVKAAMTIVEAQNMAAAFQLTAQRGFDLGVTWARENIAADKDRILTVRNEHGRAIGVVFSKTDTTGIKAHKVSWKSDGKNLRLNGTDEFIPGKRWRSVESATRALLAASADLVEPAAPKFVISRSNVPADGPSLPELGS